MLIRPAEPDDTVAVARVHVRSWQVAYQGLMPDVYLRNLRPEDRAATYDFATSDPNKPRTLVAIQYRSIVGFVTTVPAGNSTSPDLAELNALYVDPVFWGRGIGVELITAARELLRQTGFRQAQLWILSGNTRAQRFYYKDGWRPDGTERTDTVWGIRVEESRYVRAL